MFLAFSANMIIWVVFDSFVWSLNALPAGRPGISRSGRAPICNRLLSNLTEARTGKKGGLEKNGLLATAPRVQASNTFPQQPIL